jgi:signal peptidase I
MEEKEGKGKIKKIFQKIWFLLWKDNSVKGWIFSLIFLFVFIELIFFPFMNLITGTTLPLAIVESCSMHHEGNFFSDFSSWFDSHKAKYENLNITKGEFEKFSLKRGFSKGDIILLIKANPETLKIGDIIAFTSGTRGTPVIHRIISIKEFNGEKIFSTIGDNNAGQLTPGNNYAGIDEREIKSNQFVGKAVVRIVPKLGWVKLIFFEALRPESERGFCKAN